MNKPEVDYLLPYRKWVGDSMIKSGVDWFMAKCPSHPDNKRSLAINKNGQTDKMIEAIQIYLLYT